MIVFSGHIANWEIAMLAGVQEKEVGRERTGERRRLSFLRQRVTRRCRREEIDRRGAVMADREAKLAIVVRKCRHLIAVRRR
jgi:hypothetical protein